MDGLVALGEPLVRVGDQRQLVLASSVTDASRLPAASSRLKALRDDLLARGVEARAAAFTSLAPGVDFTRLATDQSADIVVVDAPDRLLEDARLLGVLENAPCDVAVLVDGARGGDAVIVPFAGAEHDWSAIELGAWYSLGSDLPLQLAGGDERRGRRRESSARERIARRAAGVRGSRRAAPRRARRRLAPRRDTPRRARRRRADRPVETRRGRTRAHRTRCLASSSDAARPPRPPPRRARPADESTHFTWTVG